MNWKDVKHALISIFVGACVAFFASLADGLVQWLQSMPTDSFGPIAAVTRYAVFLYHRQPPPHA